MEADLGKLAARLTRRALDGFSTRSWYEMYAFQRAGTRFIFMAIALLLLVSCEIASEDDNLRIVLSQRSYALTENIDIQITVLQEGYYHGPCWWWFEKKSGQVWEKVGECPETNFVDEPFPQAVGDMRAISLPTVSLDSEVDYNYYLKPGTYRYAQQYYAWADQSISVSYSPEFDTVPNGR